MVTVHNIRLDRDFTVTYNKTPEMPGVSWGAKGLLWYILSRSSGWKIHVWQLAKIYTGDKRGNGKPAVSEFIKELRHAGYLVYTKIRKENGQWDHIYTAYPMPFEEFKIKFPELVKPAMAKPAAVKPPILPSTESPSTELQKHVTCQENALSSDDVNHAEKKSMQSSDSTKRLTLNGKAKKDYEKLSEEQKQSFELLVNMPPVSDSDEKFNVISAIKCSSEKTLGQIQKAIKVYHDRLEKGEKPRKMGAYLQKIINEGFEPNPTHFDHNKGYWETNRNMFKNFPYEEKHDYIYFRKWDKEINFRLTIQEFEFRLQQIHKYIKENLE